MKFPTIRSELAELMMIPLPPTWLTPLPEIVFPRTRTLDVCEIVIPERPLPRAVVPAASVQQKTTAPMTGRWFSVRELD